MKKHMALMIAAAVAFPAAAQENSSQQTRSPAVEEIFPGAKTQSQLLGAAEKMETEITNRFFHQNKDGPGYKEQVSFVYQYLLIGLNDNNPGLNTADKCVLLTLPDIAADFKLSVLEGKRSGSEGIAALEAEKGRIKTYCESVVEEKLSPGLNTRLTYGF